MGYSANDALVRVDFFKDTGKWYCTEAVDMNAYYNESLIHKAVLNAIIDCVGTRYSGMTAIVLEPYHVHSHPIMVVLP